MKTRDEIISEMCSTMRHDFGLAGKHPMCISLEEARMLKIQMSQIYEHVIEPLLKSQKQSDLKEDLDKLRNEVNMLKSKMDLIGQLILK